MRLAVALSGQFGNKQDKVVELIANSGGDHFDSEVAESD